jgi:ABC-type branched-subunit amino acid transport system substrate-binding protein
MSEVSPVKVGLLADYVEGEDDIDPTVLRALQLTFEEFVAARTLERPIELVVRAVQGLPKGSFRAVLDAFYELVDEDCVVIFGPYVSENGVPLARYIDELGEVPCITMAATETMLGEWVFALNNGSMEEEPVIMAAVAKHDGRASVGIAYEQSLIGQDYLRVSRRACVSAGLRVTGEVAIPQVASEHQAAMQELRAGKPDCIFHVGFGLGLIGMNDALSAVGWDPPRYTTTAFEFAYTSEWWMQQVAGWIGLDSFDERNPVGKEFLDRFEARFGERPEYFMPVFCHDMARVVAIAISNAAPLTGAGVKDALEHIKMVPAASGAPGTYLRFGRFIRQGWVGAEYLVARRALPDASRTVFHGTIAGTVGPAELSS